MPQPVDLQTEVARASAAERIQQIADRASLAAQQRQSMAEEETRVTGETSVHQPDPKGEEVDSEARRRNPYVGRRRRKKSDKDAERDKSAHTFYTADENAETADDPEHHDFDVTI